MLSVYIHLACSPLGKYGHEWACYWANAAKIAVMLLLFFPELVC